MSIVTIREMRSALREQLEARWFEVRLEALEIIITQLIDRDHYDERGWVLCARTGHQQQEQRKAKVQFEHKIHGEWDRGSRGI
jgi:DNA-binding SARP family transcriptional activator